MASRSSISSSDAPDLRGRFPCALALALLMLLGVEAAVRLAPARNLIPYAGGLAEHFAVANSLAALGAADVAFIGSSMTREAVAAPLVRGHLERALDRDLYVANYSASALVASETSAIVNYMVRHEATPRLLIIEASPQQLRPSVSFRLGTVAIFWDLRDWMADWRQRGRPNTRVLPLVIRREVGQWWLTLRYRERLGQWTRETLGLARPANVPMFGDYSQSWHSKATLSLAHPGRKQSLLARWANRNLKGGQYPKTDPRLVRRLEEAIQTARRHGAEVVLCELPVSRAVRRLMPPEVYQEFYALMERLSSAQGVPFYRVADLGVSLGDEHFIDTSHMNQHGARIFTDALTSKVILPHLAATDAGLMTSAAGGEHTTP